MRHALFAVLIVTLGLGACGRIRDSRLNPFNWFGGSTRSQTVAPVPEEVADPRPLVSNVTALAIERMPGGAVVRATGVPPTQGYWAAELVERPIDDNGVLVFDFRVAPPPAASAVSTVRSREITVASFLSDKRLETIRTITVQGANSARSSRR